MSRQGAALPVALRRAALRARAGLRLAGFNGLALGLISKDFGWISAGFLASGLDFGLDFGFGFDFDFDLALIFILILIWF